MHCHRNYVTVITIGSGGASQWNEYLIAGGQMVGEHFTKTPSGGTPITEETRYFVTDHLGSISVLTDETGAVVERLSYEAWGKRRFPDGTDDPTGSITSQTTRGFTGHEMIDQVGLVNMNGRIYDPNIGRFMSADPTIPNILNTQDLNRYSYVRNNPLSGADPTGFGGKWWRALLVFIAAIVAVVVFVALPTIQVAAGVGTTVSASGEVVLSGTTLAINAGISGAAVSYVTSGGNGKAALIGGLSASAFSAVGAAFGHEVSAFGSEEFRLDNYVGRVAAHGTVGGLTSIASGGKFLSGFLSAGVSAAAGPIDIGGYTGALAKSAVVGGFGSIIGGGKFQNGAITGAFRYLYNDCSNGVRCLNPNAKRENPGIEMTEMQDEDGNWMWVPKAVSGASATARVTGNNIVDYMPDAASVMFRSSTGFSFALGNGLGLQASSSDNGSMYLGGGFVAGANGSWRLTQSYGISGGSGDPYGFVNVVNVTLGAVLGVQYNSVSSVDGQEHSWSLRVNCCSLGPSVAVTTGYKTSPATQ